jgi:hypothetical protein
VTRTARVQKALDAAKAKWPGTPTATLAARLIAIGGDVVERELAEGLDRRVAAMQTASSRYGGLFEPGHLQALREDWPE